MDKLFHVPSNQSKAFSRRLDVVTEFIGSFRLIALVEAVLALFSSCVCKKKY